MPPATLRIPENGGCWVKRGVELWREFQQEDEQPTSYAGTLVGVFSVAFSTASFGAPVSGIALLIPRVDSEELASFPQVRLRENVRHSCHCVGNSLLEESPHKYYFQLVVFVEAAMIKTT